ncbi:acyl transferase domain-containing protein [Jackrogersella minutella]|nr:acyl transferase domain-containing protein [Jackrogersella minutella]
MIKRMEPGSLDALSFTLAERSSHLKFRSFLLATPRGEGIDKEPGQPNMGTPQSNGPEPLPIVFLFTGRGAQYLCTAIQIALIELLRSCNVQPTYTVGHSSGEIAAAYAAGLLTTEEAILVAYLRGLAVKRLHTSGQMIAVGLSAEAAEALILEQGLELQVCVACVNPPESLTLSGQSEGIGQPFEKLQGKTFARKLKSNSQAYHSHLTQKVGHPYEELLRQNVWNTSAVNVTPQEHSAQMVSLLGNLFVSGHPLRWSAVNGWSERVTNMKPLHNLPPYPRDCSAGLMWNEPRASIKLRNRRHARHELLASQQLAGNGIDFC